MSVNCEFDSPSALKCSFPLQVRAGVSVQVLQLRPGEEIQVRPVQGLSRRDSQRL